MKAFVIYESMFGNTEQIARSIAAGLGEQMDVDLVRVGDAPAAVPAGVDLLVVGGPTHAFSMSRLGTRQNSITQGADPSNESPGIREWLDHLSQTSGTTAVSTFDTRVLKMRHLPGSAAAKAARALRGLGFSMVTKPSSFYVKGVPGPLAAGELDRAHTWGRSLGDEAGARLTGQSST